MAGFFDQLRDLGGAHLRHVQALRQALGAPDLQTARDGLAAYLQGLSDKALAGFRMSLGIVAAGESNPQVQQALQWIQGNVDALRSGRYALPTAATLPPHGLAIEQVGTLLEHWDAMAPEAARAAFEQTMGALDARGRAEFATHCEALAAQLQAQAAQLEAADDAAWGTSFEDRMAYAQARITTGARGANEPARERLAVVAQGVLQVAQAARAWVPAPAAAAAADEPKDVPATAPPAARPPARPAVPSDAPPAASSAPVAGAARAARGVDLQGFPADGTPSQQLDFMRTLLEREKAEGGMDPARAAALGDFVDQLGGLLQREEQRAAAGVPEGDLDAMRADLQARMGHVAELRSRMERFADMHRDVRREDAAPAGSRAAAVRARVDAMLDDVAGLRTAGVVASRESEARALETLHMDLVRARARLGELAASDDEVCKYEADTLRATAQALRIHHRRGHAMIARPLWPGGAQRVEPSGVAVIGPAALQEAMRAVAAPRRLELLDGARPGVDPASAAWRALQRASVAVFDLGSGDAQTYYRLGQAYALGTELVLLARTGTAIPFDVAQHIVEYADEAALAARLPELIDDALYGVQTHGQGALMHATLARCRALAERAVGVQAAGVLLGQLEATVTQPLDFRAALEQFLGQLGNSRLVLLHPRWPARYPAAEGRRCFVVMPFAARLEATQAMYRAIDADLGASGVEVVRGDEAAGQEIVASIWDETASASHVLVDLTGYNLNVCLELGMADAIGRDVLLIGIEGTSDGRFALIDKRRIHHYGADGGGREALLATVRAFVQRTPTLA